MEYSKKVLVIASAGGHLTQALCATSTCSNIALVSNKKNISNEKKTSKTGQEWNGNTIRDSNTLKGCDTSWIKKIEKKKARLFLMNFQLLRNLNKIKFK